MLSWIRQDDDTLSRPQHACAYSEQRASEDDVAKVLGVVVAEVGGDVDTVAQSTERQRPADTQLVGNGAGEETYNSKSAIECNIRVVARLWV